MKKIILSAIISIALLNSCTQNVRVKVWGGEGIINLPAGRKLVNVTWKESDIWYLTRPMKAGDIVEAYQFQEESSWGMIEGTYNIVETK